MAVREMLSYGSLEEKTTCRAITVMGVALCYHQHCPILHFLFSMKWFGFSFENALPQCWQWLWVVPRSARAGPEISKYIFDTDAYKTNS